MESRRPPVADAPGSALSRRGGHPSRTLRALRCPVAGHPDWRKYLAAPGAIQMQHLARLMAMPNRRQYLARVPDPDLLVGDRGKVERLYSNRLTATRGAEGDYALVYSANGRAITVRMDRLAGPAMDAFWFNPRNGQWHGDGTESADQRPFAKQVPSGGSAPLRTFVPPGSEGDGNDWVLVLQRPQG